MFSLPNFCRVCLKYDKNLIDLAHIENEPNETLMSKLQLCVSEVEWTTFKPLLCHPCIKRLNIAYSFKKQCVQSAGVLKNYVELVKESQKKNESQSTVKIENTLPQGGAYMLLPNQKYVKILVGSQNQGTTGNTNTFQNVFLNLIPTTTLSTIPKTTDTNTQKNKDTNQNVFLNINNTFQKFIPITSVDPPPLKKSETNKKAKEYAQSLNVNVHQLLTESKAEEMSVEIDPTSFLSVEHDDPSSSEDELKNDWDEVITKQKIDPKQDRVNGTGSGTHNGKGNTTGSNFVPILPKEDFYSGGHFLSNSFDPTEINCESCQRTFPSIRLLKQHLKQFHLGKLPFKCEYCYLEHLTRSDYDACVKRHKSDPEATQNTSLTLKDFTGNPSFDNDALSISLITETPADHNLEPNENGDYVCEVCNRIFNSSAGLLRHRVRKHNQKNRKKYFIKGMKNAKCDICNREFSTQSYMQLHKKLHLRDDVGYKYKVQGKSKYKDLPDTEEDKEGDTAKEQNGEDKKDKDSENIDVTPDISALQEQNCSESESEHETEHKNKKRKVDDDDGTSDSQEAKDPLRESKSEGNSMSSNDVDMGQEQNEDDQEESDSSEEESHDTEDQDSNEKK